MTGTRPQPRQTAQKEAIRQALKAIPAFISAQDLCRRLEDDGTPISLATVYRQLGALVESGEADTIPIAGGQLYRACAPGNHHHHLVCENCGRAVEIEPPSEDWIRAVGRQNRYQVTRHVLEVFGLCPGCAAPPVTAGPARRPPSRR
ncbi:MAG: transcriptional repressor [Propionibacteriaceae bacterium]|jgi:Fur family ferric uptake transcriptional regulator|nr:transcriptional repressor [Propionibacteriaceae bacterium]